MLATIWSVSLVLAKTAGGTMLRIITRQIHA